jgi:hypothetical protein
MIEKTTKEIYEENRLHPDDTVWIKKEDVNKIIDKIQRDYIYNALNKVNSLNKAQKHLIQYFFYKEFDSPPDVINQYACNKSVLKKDLEDVTPEEVKGNQENDADSTSKEDIYLHRECSCGRYFKVLEKDNKPWQRMLCPQCQIKMDELLR